MSSCCRGGTFNCWSEFDLQLLIHVRAMCSLAGKGKRAATHKLPDEKRTVFIIRRWR